MIQHLRDQFNGYFSEEIYQAIKDYFAAKGGREVPFRIAETPVFLPDELLVKVEGSIAFISQQLENFDFEQFSHYDFYQKIIKKPDYKLPQIMSFDFGLMHGEKGVEPKIVEIQAFPSLFAYQHHLGLQFQEHYPFLSDYEYLLGKNTSSTYLSRMKDLFIRDLDAENCILLELDPENQKTYIDFALTEDLWGIPTINIRDVILEKGVAYYQKNDALIPIKRVYNRIIPDEIVGDEAMNSFFLELINSTDIQWIIHPIWYYFISKLMLPYLDHPSVPKTYFVKDFPSNENPENYVLKPIFSFAGQGVKLDITSKDLEELQNPENFVLQQKIAYEPLIQNRTGEKSIVELRFLFIRDEEDTSYIPMINLARLSKGRMINVSHNTDKDWVGGTIAFFKPL